MKAKLKPQELYTVPERQRRKVAEEYRKAASNPKWKKADRAEFARMAEAWERTLPKPKERIS